MKQDYRSNYAETARKNKIKVLTIAIIIGGMLILTAFLSINRGELMFLQRMF